MSENFPNQEDTHIKIQEVQRATNKVEPHRPTPRHSIIKMQMLKIKEDSKGSKRNKNL